MVLTGPATALFFEQDTQMNVPHEIMKLQFNYKTKASTRSMTWLILIKTDYNKLLTTYVVQEEGSLILRLEQR